MSTITMNAPNGACTDDANCYTGTSPTDMARAHLHTLFDGAPVEHFGMWKTITNEGKQNAGPFNLDAASLELAAHAFVTEQEDYENRFVRCTPVAELPQEPGSQGLDEDATGSMVFWGDVDTEKAEVSKDEALAAIYAVFPDKPPTLVIDSGGGLHPYWKLTAFCTDLARIRATNTHIAEKLLHVGGDSAVKNVGRVMRLAGTYNRKEGRDNALVQIVQHNPDAVYGLDDLNSPVAETTPAPTPAAAPPTPGNRYPSERMVRDALDKAPTEGRNKRGFDLACQLRDNGYSQEEAEHIGLTQYVPHTLRTTPDGEVTPYTEREYRASVKQAFDRPPREPSGTAPSELKGETPLFSDIDNARRFVKMFGDRIRYCHQWGCWLIWDGSRWRRDDAGTILELAKETAMQIFAFAVAK